MHERVYYDAYCVLAEILQFMWSTVSTGIYRYPTRELRAKMAAYVPVLQALQALQATTEDSPYSAKITRMTELDIMAKFKRHPALAQLCKPLSDKLK